MANKAIVKAGGQTHKVFKKKVDKGIGDKGDIVVDHTAGPSAGKWDKINLTNMAKAKTVAEGVASVKKWHREHPEKAKNGGKIDAFSKVRKAMKPKKEKMWMDKEKKNLSKIQLNKKR